MGIEKMKEYKIFSEHSNFNILYNGRYTLTDSELNIVREFGSEKETNAYIKGWNDNIRNLSFKIYSIEQQLEQCNSINSNNIVMYENMIKALGGNSLLDAERG